MMEGLAAASGVLAVVGLAGQVAQGCSYLRGVFDDANSAPREIRSIANELSIIEQIVLDTPDADLHEDELDFCNEKLAKLRKVVCKYADLDSAGRYRRWGKRLSMAMSADKIHKHLSGLREARKYLEHIQNGSSLEATLAKSQEVLESVRHLSTSQYEATQITSRTEGKVDEISGITRETQKALRELAERFVHRDEVTSSWSESNVERLIKAVEKIVERRLEDHKFHPKYSRTKEICTERSHTDEKIQRLLQARNVDSMALVKRQPNYMCAALGPRVIEVADDVYSNYEVACWVQKDCPPPSCVDRRSKYQTPMGKILIRTHAVTYGSTHEMQTRLQSLSAGFGDSFIHPAHFPVTITTTEVVLLPQDWHHAKGAVIKSQEITSPTATVSDVHHEMKDFNRPASPPFNMNYRQPVIVRDTDGYNHRYTEKVVEKLASDVIQHLQRNTLCGDRRKGPYYQEANFTWRLNSRPRSRKPFRRRGV